MKNGGIMKCQALITSRWISSVRDEKGIAVLGHQQRLYDPQPCGDNAVLYRIREKARKQRQRKATPKDQKTFLMSGITMPAGTMWAQTALCDRHRKKAERENKELVPLENSVQTVGK